MALEPITRQEKIIAGQDLTPITRMEKFLKQFGGGGGGLPTGGAPYQQLVTDGDGNAKWENRLAYETEPVVTEIVPEETVAFSDSDFGKSAMWPPTFNPVAGSIYIVRIDGAEYTCQCVEAEGHFAFGNFSITGAGDDTGEPFFAFNNFGPWAFVSSDSASEHTISISWMQVSISKIDEKYLPDNLATKSDVEVVQTTAENAQTAADKAQATVNNAQNMANSNKEFLYSAFGSAVTFTFDKQTSGRDTFVFNAFNYYKISDFNPAPEDVISFKGTSENGTDRSTINTGRNAMGYGFFIVVAAAGRCSITLDSNGTPVTREFIAPSAGIYACYKENNLYQTAGTGEFTLRGSTGSSPITGLLLKSSTAGSTKKFKITVDDSGTISATEVLA